MEKARRIKAFLPEAISAPQKGHGNDAGIKWCFVVAYCMLHL